MKIDEIVTALRCCISADLDCCKTCPAAQEDGCEDAIKVYAADLIENQRREIEALRQANSALRERQKWIPVAERVPEPETRVLVLDRRGNMMARTMRQLPTDKTPVFRSDGLMPGKDVTHWMPLPEAPEED